MSQVLSIKLDEGKGREAMDQFVREWTITGEATVTEHGYDLVTEGSEHALLTFENGELLLQGNFGDKGLEIMKNLASSFASKLLLDGEELDDDDLLEKWDKAGFVGKSLAILVGLVLLPLAIVLVPLLILVAVVRLVFTLALGNSRSSVK